EPISGMPHTTVMSAPVAGSSSSASGLELRPGAVEMIQQRLESVGALRLQESTGELGAATRSALARFQEANHLPITGEPDEATVRKLGLRPENIFEAPPGGAE
ncbi:MAG TPA: peptidoglycan-binding domain-containing protein, partial [Polyangia bacterium]|nr:peptidoglycan-binding domain-containing protein [Polyangia bacterium]